MPPRPGKKAQLTREAGEGNSQHVWEVGGDGADDSTGSEEEEGGNLTEAEREKNREPRRRLDEREKRLKEREEAA